MRPAWLRTALLALLALLAGCAQQPPRPATAEPEWQTLAPGLAYARAEPGLHLLRVDLQQRRLRITPLAERGRTLAEFSGAQQALAALNLSFFDREFRARGHTVSKGQAWPEPLNPEASPLLACDAVQRCQLDLDAPYPLPPGTYSAVAGTPWLIRQGQARSAADDAGCEALCARTHPRTALGLSADGHTLLLLLAEGRRESVPGLTLAETAQQLQRLGAHEALNLDGGGSSSLLLQGRSVMQRPANEPQLRRIANALLID